MIMSCYNSLAKKGKDCIKVVHNALDDIDRGRKEMALQKLSSLQEDGKRLVHAAKELAERLEAVETYYQEKDSEMLLEIRDLTRRETQLESQKYEEESQLAAQQSRLRNNEYRLSSAEEDLRNAERKREKAEEDEEERVRTGSTAGAIIGTLFGGFVIGRQTGAAVGAGISTIVNSCMKEEESARAEVNRRRNDRDNARSIVYESEQKVGNVKSQIANLIIDIERMRQQRQQSHKKVEKIRSLIVIAKKSVEFWQLFKQTSEHGVDRTDLLRELVTLAANKEEYEAVKSESSPEFIDAWEDLENKTVYGGPNHIMQIDYKCSRCSVQCIALPHIVGSAFVCTQCHSKLKYALR